MSFVPLKRRAAISYGLGQPPALSDDGVPIIRATNIFRGRIVPKDLIRARLTDLPLDRAPLLRHGEVLVVRSGAYTGDSALVTQEWEGSAPGYDLRVSPGPHLDPRFLAYSLLGRRALDQVDLAKSRAAQPHLNAEEVGEVELYDLPVYQQAAVADFLDTETARIDALIAKKRRLTALLDDRTECLLSAVFDPEIEESGEVPLRSVAELRVSNVDKKSYEGELPVALCNYTDVYYNRRVDARLEFMRATATPEQVTRLTLRGGDVLITKDSETADDIAVPALVGEDLPGVVLGYHLALLRPRKVTGGFLYWSLRTRRCRDEFALAASGVTRFGLRQNSVKRIPIPATPADRQATIIEQVEAAVQVAEDSRKRLSRQIELLIEHRQALITAAVTGELAVPGAT